MLTLYSLGSLINGPRSIWTFSTPFKDSSLVEKSASIFRRDSGSNQSNKQFKKPAKN